MRPRRIVIGTAVVAATALALVQPASAAPPTNTITQLVVTPAGSTPTECVYDVSVSLTHRGPVHVEALASDGTTNWGGGNIDLRGTGSYTFQQLVSLPKGTTATFFGALYRHQGPKNLVLLDYRAETSARTCS